MSASCQSAGGDRADLVEVFGPLELVPIAVIYPDEQNGFVYELYDGQRFEAETVKGALAFAGQ